MTLKQKLLISIALMLAMLLVVLAISAQLILLPSFASLEKQSVTGHVKRVQNAIADELKRLATTAGDYAGWDDTYRFAGDVNQKYVKDNLGASSLKNLRIDLLVIVNDNGRAIAVKAIDQDKGEEVSPPQGIDRLVGAGLPLTLHRTTESSITGIVPLPDGLLLVASRPILTSEFKGPIRGSVIMGRFLNTAFLKQLSETTQLPLQLLPLNDRSLPADLFNTAAELVYVEPRNTAEITGYGLLFDLNRQPASVLSVSLPRLIRAKGVETISYFMICFAGLALVVFLVSNTFIQKLLLSRRRHEEALQCYQTVVESTAEGIALVDPVSWRFIETNQAFVSLFGYSPDDIAQLSLLDLSCDSPDALAAQIHQLLRDSQGRLVEQRLRSRDGTPIDVELSVNTINREDREAFSLVLHDVTERKRFEQELMHQATHDALTGLPNRNTLQDRLNQAVAFSSRTGQLTAVLVLDLDNFKNINDSLGHPIGDRLLQLVAERLSSVIRRYNTLARLGGDEFVLILASVPNSRDVATVAAKVLDVFATPFELAGQELFVTASIGVSIYPHDGNDVETLLRNADMAMYQAKGLGRNGFQFFAVDMNLRVEMRLRLENQLRRAMERQEFLLHYQPKFAITGGRVVGMEALVRWQPPGESLILPDRFIPILEDTGLIIPVGEWILREACRQCQGWIEEGMGPLLVAVNISARQFRQQSLAERIGQILQETGLPAACLILEITEGTMMKDVAEAKLRLEQLKAMGIRIAIDDFGTGYSSLSYLRRFPIDDLKIDKSFVKGVADNESDATLVRTIIAMARNLNMEVIAEGVETEEQLHFLHSEGCGEVQGFLFSRPVPASQFVTLLRQRKASDSD